MIKYTLFTFIKNGDKSVVKDENDTTATTQYAYYEYKVKTVHFVLLI